MSALVALGVVGTCLTTAFMVPHVVAAVRAGRPAGTAFAWGLTALQAAVWTLYGVLSRDWLVAAPGLVTIPSCLVLAVWAHRTARTTPP